MVITELHLWRKVLLDLGRGTFPEAYLDSKLNEVYAPRAERPARQKPALETDTLAILFKALLDDSNTSTDYLYELLCLRDIFMLFLGFYALLRRSELVRV